MTSTDIAAWWGAAVASLVLLWDAYKWISDGPRLSMRLSPNMEIFGDPSREGITWIAVNISNRGTRPTTIKNLGMEYYRSRWRRLRNRAALAAVFPNPSDGFPLPRVLNPGEEWLGLIPQQRLDLRIDIEDLSRSGHLMISVAQSHRRRAFHRRLVIQARPDNARDFRFEQQEEA